MRSGATVVSSNCRRPSSGCCATSCSTRAGCSPTASSWPTCGTTSSPGRTRSWPHMSSTCGASWPAPGPKSSTPSGPSVTACAYPVRRTTMTRRLRRALVVRNKLRLRVLAGVVVVALAALAAFDLTAVTTMRHSLYGQARSELSGAVPDWGEVPALTGLGYSLPGQYDIAWLPTGGKPHMIQSPLGSDEGAFTSAVARDVTKEGFSTVTVAGQLTQLDEVGFTGGSIVVGTSL